MKQFHLFSWGAFLALLVLFGTACTAWNSFLDEHSTYVARTEYVYNSGQQGGNSVGTATSASKPDVGIAKPDEKTDSNHANRAIDKLDPDLVANAEALSKQIADEDPPQEVVVRLFEEIASGMVEANFAPDEAACVFEILTKPLDVALQDAAARICEENFGVRMKKTKKRKTASAKSASGGSKAEEPQAFCKFLRWNAPNAETIWEESLQNLQSLDAELGMRNAFRTATGFADDTQAEGQLEAFGTRYMPNAYTQYQEVRAKMIELGQIVRETFPEGRESDPTGGAMFEKADKNLLMEVARMERRRDELCFFLLFHQAGIFSEDELAEYDSRPIVISLAAESSDWPDDTPKAGTPLSAAEETFAAKYLPETHAGVQRLCGLFDEGAKQYADLRRTALALGAPRARHELQMVKTRLGEIQSTLKRYHKDISVKRLEHAFGETSAESLAALDQANAVKIQEYERKMGVKTYVEQNAMIAFLRLPGGATMEMVWCPPGTFMMGSNDGGSDEKPVHEVTLTKGFWMAKTEVTQKQWKSVMGEKRFRHKGDDLPVESVNWYDCQEFCRKAGLRLPTEAEWEYACRAGTMGDYGWTVNLEDMGWYWPNSGNEPHPVEQKQPNAWGLYDMHGNVDEWCEDWDGEYPRTEETDPKGASFGEYRVQRGGSFYEGEASCRSASRSRNHPDNPDGYPGFRPVASQD